MRRVVGAVCVALLLVVSAPRASAASFSHDACYEMLSWWRDWARPMGVTAECIHESMLPPEEDGNMPKRGAASGWFDPNAGKVWIVVDSRADHDWMRFVIAHEYGHAWGTRVVRKYWPMSLFISRTLGMRGPLSGGVPWEEEYWADTFATCLGYRRPEHVSYGKLPTFDQCWYLDHQGLLPHTSPRGLWPASGSVYKLDSAL